MLTIDDYIDRAMTLNKIPSTNKLGKEIGLTGGSISNFRTKRSWPSDTTMLKLAELAQMDQEQALLDLNIWRSEGAAKVLYQNMAKALSGTVAALFLVFSMVGGTGESYANSEVWSAEVSQENLDTVYYEKWRVI